MGHDRSGCLAEPSAIVRSRDIGRIMRRMPTANDGHSGTGVLEAARVNSVAYVSFFVGDPNGPADR